MKKKAKIMYTDIRRLDHNRFIQEKFQVVILNFRIYA